MRTIITKFGKGPHEGWEWDGKILKPFGKGPHEGWQVDGGAPIFAVALASNLIGEATVDKNIIKSSSRNTPIKYKSQKNGPSTYEELGQLAVIQLFNVVKKIMNLIQAKIK